MSPRQAWLLAIRPRTLPAATAPVLVGTAQALRDGRFAPGPALAALIGALLIQIVSNLANDLFDFKKGADTEERVGPTRVTQAGILSPRAVGTGLLLCIFLAVLVGVYLVWMGGWPIVAVGIASLICAVAYTGGPFPLGYLGLGELFVFIFFGPVAVGGTYFVQTGTLTPLALLPGVPLGLLCANILVVNNVRDVETDRKAGKRTLAARFGRPFGERLYVANLVLALGGTMAYVMLGGWGAALATLAVPEAVRLYRMLRTSAGPALNPVLGLTARLELIYSVLFSLGVLLSTLR